MVRADKYAFVGAKARPDLFTIAALAILFSSTQSIAAPRTVGPGSLAGYWVNASPTWLVAGPKRAGAPSFHTATGEPIPLLPSGALVVEERRRGRDAAGPFPPSDRSACLTEGMPTVAAPPRPHPIEIIEQAQQITILIQYFRNFRSIRMTAAPQEDPDPTYMGNSTGRWERGALVIETNAITENTNILGFIPHSDQLRIVERLRRTGSETVSSVITVEDPKTFSRPWTMHILFNKVAIRNLGEFSCGTAQ